MDINVIDMKITEDSDLSDVFDRTLNNVEHFLEGLPEHLKEEGRHSYLGGIAVGRQTFEELFTDNANFCRAPRFLQIGYLKSLQKGQHDALENEDFLVCQGISSFSLWVAALLLNRESDVAYMEKKIFNLIEEIQKH